MYIVIDRKTKEVLHTHPASTRLNYKPNQIYYKFDPNTMQIGKTDNPLPEHFKINTKGLIEDYSLQEKVEEGIIVLKNDEKIEGDRIVKLTLKEKKEKKLVPLKKDEILEKGKLRKLTLKEQVKRGVLKLDSTEKIVGSGKNEKIQQKSLEEKISEGLIKLNKPFQAIENGKIVNRTVQDVIEKNLLKTSIQAETVARLLSQIIKREIEETYEVSYEIKLIKDNMDWITDDQPENDPRRASYLKMQKQIAAIKKKYEPLKQKLKAMEFDRKPKKK